MDNGNVTLLSVAVADLVFSPEHKPYNFVYMKQDTSQCACVF